MNYISYSSALLNVNNIMSNNKKYPPPPKKTPRKMVVYQLKKASLKK